jgi:hypothetical protein
MTTEMHIGFTGTRYGLSVEQKMEIKKVLGSYNSTTIIVHHGDCIGADTDFHTICKEIGIKTIIHPPIDEKLRAFNIGDVILPSKEYIERNHDIVENTSLLIACPYDKKKEITRSGTWATIRYARKLLKKVELI